MKNILNKVALGAVMSALVVVPFLGANSAQAASSSSQPTIEHITKRNSNELVIPLKFKKFKNDKVTVEVSFKEKDDSKKVIKTFETSLNDSGKGSITLKGLNSGTSYTVKARIAKANNDNFSKFSDAKTVRVK